MKVWNSPDTSNVPQSLARQRRYLALAPALALAILALTLGLWPSDLAAQQVVNVYSSRHYDTDEALYKNFTAETGIEVRIIEGDADTLLARIKREGEFSPADLFIAVDAGRLHRGVTEGVFAPVESSTLSERIPASLRHPDGLWFGLSKRVRVLIIDPTRVQAAQVDSYEKLAAPDQTARVLIRSSNNLYNQSLLASLIHHWGEEKAEAWCRGLVAKLARAPQGGDTDQIRALAAGEGDVAVSNHYYFARMLSGDNAADREIAAKLQVVFPNQQDRGTHVNVSGAAVLKHSPNRANAIRLLEYMTTPAAQQAYAIANNEFPVVDGVELSDVLKSFGTFKGDDVNASVLGNNNAAAVRMMDRAQWR
jgi:iron(III) transport system substrate-binding protein